LAGLLRFGTGAVLGFGRDELRLGFERDREDLLDRLRGFQGGRHGCDPTVSANRFRRKPSPFVDDVRH